MRMERRLCGATSKENIWNEHIRGITRVTQLGFQKRNRETNEQVRASGEEK